MRLIGTRSSPFTRKVRIVALERKVPIEFVVDTPLSAQSRVPLFNPLAKVPVLIRDDDSVLVESSLIADWLDRQGTGDRLIPEEESERMAALQWQAIADGVLDAAVLIRMERLRAQTERSSAWIERQQAKVESGMAWMDRGLDERQWSAARQLSIASIAVGCCLSYLLFRSVEGRWTERFANVARLCAELEQRPSFMATVLYG